mgnify:CR=1 FL=1
MAQIIDGKARAKEIRKQLKGRVHDFQVEAGHPPGLGVILVGLMDIPPLDRWLPLFCIVPMLAGLAIAHYMVAKKTMGTPWLVLIYATVLMMAPAIILLGLTDSLLDLRKRIDQRKE